MREFRSPEYDLGTMWPPRPSPRRQRSPSIRAAARRSVLALLGVALLLGSCSLVEVSFESGRTHLETVAIANYALVGGTRLERLLDMLGGVQVDEAGAATADKQAEALALDLVLMREITDDAGRRILAPLADGATLYDGVGRPGDGDGFKLRVQAQQPCSLYVVQVDATARPRVLFPHPDLSTVGNPLTDERPYRIPEGNTLIELGPARGIETLYVVVAREPWVELEELLAELDAAEWPAVSQPAIVVRATQITRGLAGVRSSVAPAVSAPSGALSNVPSRLYRGQRGERMVLTRWFRHE